MALREIIRYPDPLLRKKSEKVTVFDQNLKTLVEDMAETMYWSNGIGLAAIQIGIKERVIIIDIGDLDVNSETLEGDDEAEASLAKKRRVKKLEVFINPEILEQDGEIEYEEGCLSVPGVTAIVCRREHLKLRYQDLLGVSHEIETHGLRSIVIQHEMDHCDGVVFPDRLGSLQKMMLLNKYKKLQQKEKVESE